MIDFAKTLLVPDHILTHRDAWNLGNHEEGYLTGLDNLVAVSPASSIALTFLRIIIVFMVTCTGRVARYPVFYGSSRI